VAPDGAIDRLCVPCFDAPSIFASLLDREAGSFRFGPFAINHPSERIYAPDTNVVVTTWKSPSGPHLGNFPQALSHLRIGATARMIVPERLAEF
jgi:GH15 family glucan-1,4-alpha-glucosidase